MRFELQRPPTMLNTNRQFDEQRWVNWVDYAKGVGIFLVVVGHVLGGMQPSSVINDTFWYQSTERYLYAFHMPLFFFIAGLFAPRSARRRSLIGFMSDKIAVLVYPYFVWSMFQGLLQTSHYVNHPLHPIDLLKIAYVPIDQFWFLYTLFAVMVVYSILLKIGVSNIVFLCISIACFLVETLKFDMIEWTVAHSVAYFSIYFGAGVVITKSSILVRFSKLKNGWLFGICTVCYAAVAVSVWAEYQAILSPVWAISGITATIALAILMSRSTKFVFVKLWGVLSLEIYVTHVITEAIVRIVLQKVLDLTNPLLHFVLGVIVALYAAVILTYLCQRAGVSSFAFTLSRSRLQPWTVDGPASLSVSEAKKRRIDQVEFRIT
jgi:fucose 4-O-acetylase-like acetyltransferase